jgi:hypothetical protein
MDAKDLTWIATVFDCEGCISSQKSQYRKKNGEVSNYENVVIQIGHCSEDLIIRFHTLVGMGKLYGHNYNYSYLYKTERKQVYWWKITNRPQILEFIELIWGEWISEYRRETIIKLGVAPKWLSIHTE